MPKRAKHSPGKEAGLRSEGRGSMNAFNRRRLALAGTFAVTLLVRPHTSRAADPWLPSRTFPTTATVDTILQKVRAAAGNPSVAYSERIEHLRVLQAGRSFSSDLFVRDGDYMARSTLDGETYESGTTAAQHWRRTPRGLVRLVSSDVQGDDLDRWPAALVGLSAQDCSVVGEVRDPSPTWLLRVERASDIPHFVYIDEATGALVREVTREGSRVETTTFDDIRTIAGVRRPMHWTVQGPGGTLDVDVTGIDVTAVDPKTIAIPLSTSDEFPFPAKATSLRANFNEHGQIFVPVRVEGRAAAFLLDTGTPQLDVSPAFAREVHLTSTLGHSIAGRFSLASVDATAVPVDVVDYPWGDGILGYDLFCGRIVHVDYRSGVAETLPRTGFVPPAGTDALPTNYDEGMPIVTAQVGTAGGERFVLDTGSFELVLARHFRQSDSVPHAALDARNTGRGRRFTYLEGSIETTSAVLRSFTLGRARFIDIPAYIEDDASADTYFPIDGIIGNTILRRFEWWFDADGGMTWYRYRG